jgi:hypothetical protein
MNQNLLVFSKKIYKYIWSNPSYDSKSDTFNIYFSVSRRWNSGIVKT